MVIRLGHRLFRISADQIHEFVVRAHEVAVADEKSVLVLDLCVDEL